MTAIARAGSRPVDPETSNFQPLAMPINTYIAGNASTQGRKAGMTGRRPESARTAGVVTLRGADEGIASHMSNPTPERQYVPLSAMHSGHLAPSAAAAAAAAADPNGPTSSEVHAAIQLLTRAGLTVRAAGSGSSVASGARSATRSRASSARPGATFTYSAGAGAKGCPTFGGRLTVDDLRSSKPWENLGEHVVPGSANCRLVGGKWRSVVRSDPHKLYTDYYGPVGGGAQTAYYGRQYHKTPGLGESLPVPPMANSMPL